PAPPAVAAVLPQQLPEVDEEPARPAPFMPRQAQHLVKARQVPLFASQEPLRHGSEEPLPLGAGGKPPVSPPGARRLQDEIPLLLQIVEGRNHPLARFGERIRRGVKVEPGPAPLADRPPEQPPEEVGPPGVEAPVDLLKR